MSGQTRLVSVIEVALSTAAGFVVSFLLWPPIAYLHDMPYTVASNFSITVIFTVSSLLRQYAVRRFFARGMHMLAVRLARRLAGRFDLDMERNR